MVGEFGPNGTHADGDRYAYCKHGTDRGGSWAGWTAGYVDSKRVHNKLVRLGRSFFFLKYSLPLVMSMQLVDRLNSNCKFIFFFLLLLTAPNWSIWLSRNK
jgi:hypothetical protein